jgi:transposase-like protein
VQSPKEPATQVIKNVRRATRHHFSAEDKIRIVLEGLRGEESIAELCRREGIVQNAMRKRFEKLRCRYFREDPSDRIRPPSSGPARPARAW